MVKLPLEMNVNWYLRCKDCSHFQFISVDWYRAVREKYGKNKPMLWTRCVCGRCASRNLLISRVDPEAVGGLTWLERELAEQKLFNDKVARWNGGSKYWAEEDEKHDFSIDLGPDEPDSY